MLEASAWIMTIAFSVFAVSVGWRMRRKASASFTDYAVAGTSLPLIVIAFTDLSTIMGAGNFVGEAEEGFEIGYSQLAFVVGEQGSKIAFALLFAGFAGRFAYRTLAEMMDDLILRDSISRGLVALLTLSLMVSWIGGQGLGLGLLFSSFTGADPTLIIFMFTAIFIAYAAMGGMHAVARVEFVLGALIVVLGIAYYLQVFSLVDFSPATLNEQLEAAGHGGLTDFEIHLDTLTLFLTGLLGVLGAQVYWQRCFAARDGRSARRGMLIAGTIATIFVCCTVLVGMVARALNPTVDAADAMPWLMANEVPTYMTIAVFGLVLIAANGSAAANLNAATVIVVNDLIAPFKNDITDRQMVYAGRVLTVVIGLAAAMAALYAESIIGLFARAYTLLACSVVPLMLVGLVWKRHRRARFTMGVENSNVTVWGARTALVAGAISGQVVGLYTGFAVAVGCAVFVSLLTRPRLEVPAATP